MQISKLIETLQEIQKEHGDIPVQIQSPVGEEIMDDEDFFVVPEEYPDEGWMVNIRDWPY